MVGVKRPPSFLTQVSNTLVETLRANGIRAKVEAKRIPGTRVYRLAVLSPQFKAMKHFERQDLVWRIAEKAVSQENQMRISTILTLTPDEVKGK